MLRPLYVQTAMNVLPEELMLQEFLGSLIMIGRTKTENSLIFHCSCSKMVVWFFVQMMALADGHSLGFMFGEYGQDIL